jgi:hypothetical protein
MDIEKRTEGNAFERAIADARAEIAKPELTPQGALDAVLRTALDKCEVHPAHAERAAGFVNEFRNAAVAALKTFAYSALEKAISDFYQQMRFSGLQTAPIPEDPSSYEAIAAWLLPHGWSGEEIACVRQQILSGGGTISAADYESVTIGGRVHLRERLRTWDKPGWAANSPWWDEAAWAAKWPKIEPPAAQQAAERPAVDQGLPAGWRYDASLRRAVRVA